MKNTSELTFVKTRDFNLIPSYLFKQFKEIKYDPKDLYFWGSAAADNPLTLLYVTVNKQHKIKGFMWAALDVLDRSVHVKALSIDKDYQEGDIVKRAIKILEEEIKAVNPKGDEKTQIKNIIKFHTTRPKAFQKKVLEGGWKVSKQAIMEINLE